MNDLYADYPWVPFFQELAGAILKFKDDRKPLLAWLRRDLSDLKSRDNKTLWFCEKIVDSTRNDIDPFSILAILCKKYNYETLERILPIYKDFFQINADASSSDWGLITTNTTHFFFSNDNTTINTLWDIFEKALSDKDFEKEYDYIQDKFSYHYLSYCLSWTCPNKYLGLSQNVIAFIRSFFEVNVKINYRVYKQILKRANKLIEDKALACNSLVQLTEIAQSGNMACKIWFVPGSPQNFVDGKFILGKNLLCELSRNHRMLSEANPHKDIVVLYDTDKSGNRSSLCLNMWGKFLPHKIKMKSDMLSHVEWHSYGDKAINYKNNSHYDIFFEGATTELLNFLKIDTNIKTDNMETSYQRRINELATLLEANKNLILTGAPGTGKTFLAKEIARELFSNNINKYDITTEQLTQPNGMIWAKFSYVEMKFCKMVQFHPSYDYSDFVEGLRPVKDKNGNVYFERKDGVFKEFCREALNGTISSENANKALQTFKKLHGDENYLINEKYSVKATESGVDLYAAEGILSTSDLSIINCLIGKEDNCIAVKNFCKYLKDNFLEDTTTSNQLHIFIIDEINRGEISKIFGEMFFSIEPDYRGKKGRVNTQYQNMIEDDDIFKDGFYVPENVYIIGTMNDIDRSVEDMDFAMQRRFAKVEVSAEESYQNMIAESNDFSEVEKKEIKERMTALNDAILEPDLGLGKAYQIGAAYFRKLLYYKEFGIEQAFSKLWDYHLKGLLSEYLRGNHNSKAQLEALKDAYDNKVTKHDESYQDNR